MNKTRLMILDRDRIFAEGLGICLATDGEYELCAIAHDLTKALRLIQFNEPDALIVDRTFLLNGSSLTLSGLKAQLPQAQIILLTQAEAGQAIMPRAEETLADGVVSRLLAVDTLLTAIQAMVPNQTQPSSADHEQIDGSGRKGPGQRGFIPSLKDLDKLSPREREVLGYVANGYTSKEIAKSLDIKQRTVEVHRHHLLKKLEVRGIADLVKFAIRSGLTEV